MSVRKVSFFYILKQYVYVFYTFLENVLQAYLLINFLTELWKIV